VSNLRPLGVLSLALDGTLHTELTSDIIIIDGFIIPKSINLNDIKTVDIIIGGKIIYSIPFDIITDTRNIEIKNNKYFIKFPHELFNINSTNEYFKNYLLFPIITMQFTDIIINLNSITNFDYKLIIKNIYYKQEIRRELAISPHDIDIYGYQSFDINKSSFNINASFISTGLYVFTNSKIKYFKLYLNDVIAQNLTEDLIEFYSCLIYKKESWTEEQEDVVYSLSYLPDEIINIIEGYMDIKNEYMYFIPFNTLNNEIDGMINFSRFENIKVDIKTKNNIYDGKIYNKYLNRLRIGGGVAGLEMYS
jgi:hypothetical protein